MRKNSGELALADLVADVRLGVVNPDVSQLPDKIGVGDTPALRAP